MAVFIMADMGDLDYWVICNVCMLSAVPQIASWSMFKVKSRSKENGKTGSS